MKGISLLHDGREAGDRRVGSDVGADERGLKNDELGGGAGRTHRRTGSGGAGEDTLTMERPQFGEGRVRVRMWMWVWM